MHQMLLWSQFILHYYTYYICNNWYYIQWHHMNRVLQNLCNTMRQVQKLLSDVDQAGCSHQTCLLCFKLSMIDKT